MAYVTRLHPFSAQGSFFLGCAVLAVGSVGLWRQPWVMVPGLLFFGFGAVAGAIPLLQRQVTLRVDDTGIGDDRDMTSWDEVLWLEVRDRRVWIVQGELRELSPEDFDDPEDFRPGVEPVSLSMRGLSVSGCRFRRDHFDAAVRAYAPRVADTPPYTYGHHPS